MADQKKPKTRRRYSIGEWYGVGLEALSPSERFQWAKTEIEVDALAGKPCPFQRDAICNKKGGVCSLRLYEQVGQSPVSATGALITTCPNRFLQDVLIFRWVGETILQ